METNKCPICGSSECVISTCSWSSGGEDSDAYKIECEDGLKFIIHDSINYGEPIEVKKRYNLICSLLLQNPTKKIRGIEYLFKFFYDEYSVGQTPEDTRKVNLANNMRDYPTSVVGRVEKSLVNLSRKFPYVGQSISLHAKDAVLFFCESQDVDSEIDGIWSFLCQLGYCNEWTLSTYAITVKGWEKIHELTEKDVEVQQGFIAMAFCKETESIGEIFANTIHSCGYNPQRIDLKEHNNQIVPEIFYEIRKSKFLVVDVTVPNYGAYYEAGYGEALKKQVIVCCRRDAFEDKEKRPHFDIAQKSMIVWNDEEELKEKLSRRIEATVGTNK